MTMTTRTTSSVAPALAPTQAFFSGLLQPGQRWQYTFTTPGIYPYFCSIHPGMDGVIIVE